MNRARILVVILAIGGIVGALVLFLTRARDAAKPLTYRDRTIEDWFAQMPVTPLPPPGVDLGTKLTRNVGALPPLLPEEMEVNRFK
jgi:hypothetical protein